MTYTLRSFDRRSKFLTINGLLSLLVLVLIYILPGRQSPPSPPEFEEAAEIMKESIEVLSNYCQERNINIDERLDPQKTGLIGPEMTGITTSLGHLEAKRTTINPNFASLIVELLMEAEVRQNDTIAIACSGSFPALMIASLAAARAMDLYPKIILSIGASSYGANNMNFTLLDMFDMLQERGIFNFHLTAISPGGTLDTGSEFEKDAVDRIELNAGLLGIPFVYEEDLQKNIKIRESLYFKEKESDIKAFINIGGGYSSMGTSSRILNLPPGLVKEAPLPEKGSQGMIYKMLGRGIPVIHLLYIKGIAQKYNLIWDPVTIPEYKDHPFHVKQKESPFRLFIGVAYLIYFSFILVQYNRLNNMK